MKSEKTVAFLGSGNMAGAIVGGILRSALIPSEGIYLYDLDKTKYDRFLDSGVHGCDTLCEAVDRAKYVFISVKPQNCKELFESIRSQGLDLSGKVFISIAAGVKISSVCAGLGSEAAVVRAMPNTPLLIGQGVTALSKNAQVSDGDFAFVYEIFSKSGAVLTLPEDQMNAIISVTSSSPAYVYLFIKALVLGAAEQGLCDHCITDAVCDMMIGAANMVKKGDYTPEELIRMVTSPKGTTEQAMNVLYAANIEKTVSDAMQACTKRAEELSALL